MIRLAHPELIIIFVIFLFLFAPRWVPAMLQRIRPLHRAVERGGSSDWFTVVFGLLVAIAFIYGLMNTLRLLR